MTVQYIHVSSKDRESSSQTSTDFGVQLKTHPITNVTKIGLLSADIPNTINNISTELDNYEIVVRSPTDDLVSSANVTVGPAFNTSINAFHNTESLESSVNTALDKAITDAGGVNFLDFRFYETNGKYLLRSINGDNFEYYGGNSSISSLIGFDSTTKSGARSYWSDTLVDLPSYTNTKNLFLRIKNLPINTYISSNGVVAFAKIPLGVNNYSIDYTSVNNQLWTQDVSNFNLTLSRVEVELVDENNEIVDLNGADWSFTLFVESN